MYIVIESLKNGPDDKETTVLGVHRQVKAASVQAWKLYFKEILKNIQHLSQKGNRLSIKYTILCWDERPEENTLIATWHLLWPSLERGKDKDKQQQTMLQHVKSVIAELDAGKVPNHLWNKYMSLAHVGTPDAPIPKKQPESAEPVPADQSATQEPDASASVPEEAAEVPDAAVSDPVPAEDST